MGVARYLFCAWPLKQELIGPIAVFRDIKPCAKSSSKWWQILFAEKKIHPVPYRVVESAILLEIQRTQNSLLYVVVLRRKESSEQRFSPFGLLHHQSMVGCFCLKIGWWWWWKRTFNISTFKNHTMEELTLILLCVFTFVTFIRTEET